ncbi:MAG: ribosomal RNA small subunit methyltransferase A [Bdellovibrionaceae bacterium]|nr:ribosomal RNA small subunit methyltransferase A [Pseudobdellovibrionaceae bacterium]
MIKKQLLAKLQELSLQPKFSLGQNFLISQNVVELIISKINTILKQSSLIEIGPGLGALTNHLLNYDDYTVIELDRDLAKYWKSKEVKVIEADALQLDWKSLNIKGNAVLVSNLPYQISSRLFIDRSLGPLNIQHMLLMFQKEVAQRITASIDSKAYGILSVIGQLVWDINKLCDVSPQEFYPAPKVAGRVLYFSRKSLALEKAFFLFVKQAFSQRRKMLVKNLSSFLSVDEIVSITGSKTKRAENVSPEEFYSLYNLYKSSK